jgi:hypothetical protein
MLSSKPSTRKGGRVAFMGGDVSWSGYTSTRINTAPNAIMYLQSTRSKNIFSKVLIHSPKMVYKSARRIIAVH